jgi:hypothetical protein
MAFEYKLEYFFDDNTPGDQSVFLHMKANPPVYMDRTNKEDYDILSDGEKHEFLTNIFDTAGVVEVSCKAYRLWIMKSPAYSWSTITTTIIEYLMTYYEETESSALPGSAMLDGTGFYLTKANQRRRI